MNNNILRIYCKYYVIVFIKEIIGRYLPAPTLDWPVGLVVASATDERGVLGSIPRSGKKVLLGFSITNFSVVARSLEVGGVTPPWLGKHVKLISPGCLSQIFDSLYW